MQGAALPGLDGAEVGDGLAKDPDRPVLEGGAAVGREAAEGPEDAIDHLLEGHDPGQRVLDQELLEAVAGDVQGVRVGTLVAELRGQGKRVSAGDHKRAGTGKGHTCRGRGSCSKVWRKPWMSAGLLVEGIACKSAVLLCTSSGEIVKKIEGVPNFMQYARISDRELRRRIGDQGTLDPIKFIRGRTSGPGPAPCSLRGPHAPAGCRPGSFPGRSPGSRPGTCPGSGGGRAWLPEPPGAAGSG